MPLLTPIARRLAALFVRRPAVPLALALIIGIALEPVAPVVPLVWFSCLTAMTIAAIITFARATLCSSFLLVAMLLGGLLAAQLETSYFPSNHIAAFTAEEPKLAQLEVQIISPPRVLSAMPQARPLPPKQNAKALVTRVLTQTGWQRASGEINLTIDQPHPRLAFGQRVRVIGSLFRPTPAMNPGQFDHAALDRRNRILASVNVPHVDGVTILTEPGFAILQSLRNAARRLLASGFKARDTHDYATLQALVLGDRDAQMHDVQEDFSHSGAAHLLAISGLHVIIVATFAMFACRLLALPPRTATWITMGVVLLYACVVTPGPPALRATVLCIAFGVAQLTGRTRDGVQVLALCAAGLLLYHPHDLYGAGFQLSFLTVLGMLLSSRRLMEWCNSWMDSEDARVARSFRPPKVWGSLWLRVRAHLAGSVAIGCVAWLVSMPLVMIHFDQLNPWAVFAGLLLLPVVFVGLLAGLLKIVATLLIPSLAHQWATMAAAPMIWLRHEVSWLARLPGADVAMSAPATWKIIIFYALVCLPLLPWAVGRLRNCIRCSPLAAACFLAFLPLFPGISSSANNGETRVTLLAIGAGQIGVVELADGRVLLFDDGSSSLADPLRSCLAPFLRSRGHGSVQTIFLSHPDFDHISAAAQTADDFHASRICISPVFRIQSRGNVRAEALLRHVDQAGIPIEILARGQKMFLDDNTDLEVLWPPHGRSFTSTNNAGVVLRLKCHGRTVLFPADIQAATERELVEIGSLQADVLVAPHHGSAELSTGDFVKSVNPKMVLSSNDRRLSKKQRSFDQIVSERAFYRTSRCGAITVHISNTGELRVETFLKGTKAAKS